MNFSSAGKARGLEEKEREIRYEVCKEKEEKSKKAAWKQDITPINRLRRDCKIFFPQSWQMYKELVLLIPPRIMSVLHIITEREDARIIKKKSPLEVLIESDPNLKRCAFLGVSSMNYIRQHYIGEKTMEKIHTFFTKVEPGFMVWMGTDCNFKEVIYFLAALVKVSISFDRHAYTRMELVEMSETYRLCAGLQNHSLHTYHGGSEHMPILRVTCTAPVSFSLGLTQYGGISASNIGSLPVDRWEFYSIANPEDGKKKIPLWQVMLSAKTPKEYKGFLKFGQYIPCPEYDFVIRFMEPLKEQCEVTFHYANIKITEYTISQSTMEVQKNEIHRFC